MLGACQTLTPPCTCHIFTSSQQSWRRTDRQTDKMLGGEGERGAGAQVCPGDQGCRGRTRPGTGPASDSPLPVKPCEWGCKRRAGWGRRVGRPEGRRADRSRGCVRQPGRAGQVTEALRVPAAVPRCLSASPSSRGAAPGGLPARTAAGRRRWGCPEKGVEVSEPDGSWKRPAPLKQASETGESSEQARCTCAAPTPPGSCRSTEGRHRQGTLPNN